MKLKLFLALVMLIPATVMAQSDLALYSMRSLPQVTRSNPALTPYSRVNVSLPLMNYMGRANSNQFAIAKFLQADPFASEDVWQEAARRTFRSIYEDLEEENNIFATDIEVDLLSFGFKLGWNYFYFRSSERISLDFRYPKSLFDLFNPDIDLQGENIVLSGTDLSALHYREYALTYSRKLLPSLTVGATAKYLYGMDAIRGDNLQVAFTSTPNQPNLNFTGNGQVYTSLGAASVLSNALETGFLPVSDIQSYAYRYNNHGFALDFGVNMQLLDRINVSASVLDLGGITWKENLKSYTEEGFEYKINYFQEFDTTDFGDIVEVGEALENLDPLELMIRVTDSLVKVISTDIKSESFRTSIPTKINLATSFALTDRIDIGVLSHSVFNRGRFRQSAMLSSNIRVGNALSFLLTYAIQGGSFQDFGGGLSLNLGPVQIYAITDNAVSFVNLDKNVHLRFGINLTFNNDFED